MKRYPAYKDSGVEWLGEIPEGWEVKKLKYATENLDNIRVPLSAEERGQVEGSYPYYGATGIIGYVNDYLFDGEYLLIGEDGAPFFLENEDVAFTAKGKFWVNNHAHILKTYENSDIRFVMHSLNCVDYKEYITGSTRDKLTQSDLSCIVIPLPPLPEQQAIANFLDQKTAKIDELIKKNERLIELLREKRQAVISHAVTKGLDPNAKMTDSGIEWIGEIPEGWEVKKIKNVLLPSRSGIQIGPFGSQLKSEFIKEKGVRVYGQEHVIADNFIIGSKCVNIDKFNELRVYEVTPGDIIVTMMGTTGKCVIIPDGVERGIMDSHLIRLRVNKEKIQPTYLSSLINDSGYIRAQITLEGRGSIMEGLNTKIIRNMIILLPSIREQKVISDYLSQKTKKINELINKIQSQIEKLKEYRQALISNIVTGKVRVDES